MSIQSQAVDAIVNSIKKAFESQTDNLRYDKTYKMKIGAIIENGKYSVKMAGQFMVASPLNNAEYSVGDVVYVLAPCGNFSDLLILGKIQVNKKLKAEEV